MSKINIIYLAEEFARKAHVNDDVGKSINGVKRLRPVHLQEVADLTWASGGSDAEIAAAWLHDTIEDTDTILADIKKKFGEEVAAIVEGLTDLEGFEDLPTLERKTKQAERVKSESDSVKRVKIADQTSNVRLVVTEPPLDWEPENNPQYIAGAKLIVDQCKGVSPMLENLFYKEYKKGAEKYGLS
jgi:guanosine-3',5'-bis(diphosphate) 3'-pyrophosphohydrolase